jgi:hypothetical protein
MDPTTDTAPPISDLPSKFASDITQLLAIPSPVVKPADEPAKVVADAAVKPDEKPKDTAGDEWKSAKAADWKALKEARDAAAKEADLFKRQVADLQAKIKDPSDLEKSMEALRAERDVYDEQLRLVAVERHPKFEGYFKAKVDTVLAGAKNVLGAEKAADLQKALRMPDGEQRDAAIEELTGDASALQQQRIAALLTRMDEITVERETEISKWRETASKFDTDQKTKLVEQKQNAEKILAGIITGAVKDLEVFQPKPGDDKWNAETEQSLALARHLFGGENTVEDLARAAVWAAAAPRYRMLSAAYAAENKQLKDEIAKLRSANPSIKAEGDKADSVSPGTGLARNEPPSFSSAFAKNILGAMRS